MIILLFQGNFICTKFHTDMKIQNKLCLCYQWQKQGWLTHY